MRTGETLNLVSRVGLLLVVVFMISGCSIRKMAIRQVVPIMEDGMSVFEMERDLEFARDALAGNIKLLEALQQSDPENPELRLMLARAYGSYALAFPQDTYERYQHADPRRAEQARDRARDFFLRSKSQAMGVLETRLPDVWRVLNGEVDGVRAELLEDALTDATEDDVPALFWTAYGWGNWVNLSRDDMAAIAEAPLVERIMRRVLELNETYYLAGPHLFFGAWYGGRPQMLGGKPDLAREHFDRADEINDGKFLLVPVYRARFLAVPTQNPELYDEQLQRVLDAPADILPSQRLATELAKRKARRFLETKDQFF